MLNVLRRLDFFSAQSTSWLCIGTDFIEVTVFSENKYKFSKAIHIFVTYSLLMSSISKYQIVKISKYQNLKLLKKLSFAKFFIRNYTFSCQIWIQNVLTFDLVMKNLAKLSFFSNFRFWYFVILTIWYFDIEDMSRLFVVGNCEYREFWNHVSHVYLVEKLILIVHPADWDFGANAQKVTIFLQNCLDVWKFKTWFLCSKMPPLLPGYWKKYFKILVIFHWNVKITFLTFLII